MPAKYEVDEGVKFLKDHSDVVGNRATKNTEGTVTAVATSVFHGHTYHVRTSSGIIYGVPESVLSNP